MQVLTTAHAMYRMARLHVHASAHHGACHAPRGSTWLDVHASAHHGACHAPRGSSCGTSASGAGLSVICERARAPCTITIPNHSIAAYRACCRADGRGSGCGRAVTVPRCLGGVWNRLPCNHGRAGLARSRARGACRRAPPPRCSCRCASPSVDESHGVWRSRSSQ